MGMLLSVRGIRKSFGAVAALRHADLDMAEGEVVALLGDNGAGKSTFVRLLSGAGRPDGGTFRFGGNPVDLAKYSVRKARDMGIETVHQDRCLCEGQSLWRNMFVGRHVRTRWGFIDIAAEREATRVMLGEWLGLGGAGLDPDADVRVLSGGERQALAIGRAMYFGAGHLGRTHHGPLVKRGETRSGIHPGPAGQGALRAAGVPPCASGV